MELLGLHNLKAAKGSKTRKRRVGRGNASGKGNYSGRGMKGQRARSSGKSGLKLKGIKGYLQRIPKSKGFHSRRIKKAEVNLKDLARVFGSGEEITAKILLAKGLVKSISGGVKILGKGGLSKKLNIKADAFSSAAEKAIIKAGGTTEVVASQPKKEVPKKVVK